MTWNDILPIISVLAGVFVGWVLNEFSCDLRAYRENQRQLKEILYNLLEIWYAIKNSNTDPIVDITIDKISSRFSIAPDNKKVLSFLRQIFEHFAEVLIQQIMLEELKKAQGRYQDSINALAQIDPLLAYRLSGKSSVYNYLHIIDKSIENIKSSITQLDKADSEIALETVKSILKPKLLDETVKDLEDDIKELSRKLSLRTRRKINCVLRRAKVVIPKEIDEQLDKFLNDYLENFPQKINR